MNDFLINAFGTDSQRQALLRALVSREEITETRVMKTPQGEGRVVLEDEKGQIVELSCGRLVML